MIEIKDYIKSYDNILDSELCKKIVNEGSDNFEHASVADGIKKVLNE